MARSNARNAGPRVQHKDTVLAALTAAQKPMTSRQLDAATRIGQSEVRKAVRKLAAADAAYIYAWNRDNVARGWTPVWASGKGEHAPMPEGARPVAVDMPPPKVKPEAAPEQMERTAHLTVPVTRCRTTFVGGVNLWGLVT